MGFATTLTPATCHLTPDTQQLTLDLSITHIFRRALAPN
jgi:hypothetical protein